MMQKIGVIFVCMGNICRSPTAQGVFSAAVEREGLTDAFMIDSAGTHAYHVGDAPDRRAQEVARRRGIEIGRLRARRICAEDFGRFDYVVAMDRDNLAGLEALCPEEYLDRLHLLLSFAPDLGIDEVPDPYYGGGDGFERVFSMVEEAAAEFLRVLCARHGLKTATSTTP